MLFSKKKYTPVNLNMKQTAEFSSIRVDDFTPEKQEAPKPDFNHKIIKETQDLPPKHKSFSSNYLSSNV